MGRRRSAQRRMVTYIIRRLLLMIPTLLGVTAVVFFVMALAPGGFGGALLNQDAAQTEGEEAKRIRQYFMRRYGLDRPVVVQFGRWLNQVSPVGFGTSSKLRYTDQQRNEIREILRAADALATDTQIDQKTGSLLALAGYLGANPADLARDVVAINQNLSAGLELLASIDPNLGDGFRAKMESLAVEDLQEAARVLTRDLYLKAAGRDRLLFSRPVIKWPNLGNSLRGRPVSQLLRESVPITLLLNAITIPIIYTIAIFTGIYAARHRGKFFDLSSGVALMASWSIPVIWAGVMLIGYLANKQHLKWFPTAGLHDLQADTMPFLPAWTEAGFQRGWLLDMAWHLVLPVVCLTYGGFAVLAKLSRGALLENLSADYVRTARAKGVPESQVLFRHAFRNSILPLITVAASIIPSLMVGSVVIENIFSIQGMGKLGVDAAFMKDRELVMGVTLIGGVIGLLSELIRDLCYAIADPRVSYE